MLDYFLTDEEGAWRKRDGVLRKNAVNIMDGGV